VIPLLNIHPEECKTGYSGDICTLMFIAALGTIAKLWKQLRCPTTDEWIMKLWYIYTMRITQPQGIMTWGLKVNGCNITLSEVSQDQKQKRCMFSLIHRRYIQR
jgi:hypothetical protein